MVKGGVIIQILDRKQVERIRKMYPEGTQICLDEMEGERNMPSGLKGKVCYVDDAGQIHVNWENGSSLKTYQQPDPQYNTKRFTGIGSILGEERNSAVAGSDAVPVT